MQFFDYALIIIYFVLLLGLGFVHYRRRGGEGTAADMIVGGRMLTLPAFVASLVSTWYGGILGVGEYSFRYGLSNWLVFGLPYYLAAMLFALFLAKKARRSNLLTIPARLLQTYDKKTALAGSIVIFLMTLPAAYILMLGILCEHIFGFPFWVGILAGTIFSVVYLFVGGFRAVVRTDILQFVLMFTGFAVLLITLYLNYGGIDFLTANLPAAHFTWHGGNSGWYIAVWYVIALSTLIEPAFFQRCFAAKSDVIAQRGIFVAIGCWAFFDFMTTSCGLYARALMPELTDPVASFPLLAEMVLPTGLLGLFALALLATVMSTVDSYSFLAASTFGHDIIPFFRKCDDDDIKRFTRLGLILSTGLAVIFALFFRSVVDIWHAFGSIGTPALLVPLFFSFVGRRRLPSKYALWSILSSGTVSMIWYLSKIWTGSGDYLWEIEPIFPGLLLSLMIHFFFAENSVNRELSKTKQ